MNVKCASDETETTYNCSTSSHRK